MAKRTFRLFTIITALALNFISLISHAQTNCSYDVLIGEWKETMTIPGIATNLDSLKTSASSSKKNLGIWNFKTDRRYTYLHALQRSKYKRKSVYVFDANSCEVILGTKLNAREQANLEILFLDDHHLIYKSNNNPKGYYTHVLVRHRKKTKATAK